MDLQTKIILKKETKNRINYNSKLVLLGSCFSKNIGNKLTYFKFQTHQNPFGILFHPKAIENLITNAINEKEYVSKDLIFQDERWHSFDAHSNLSSSNQEILLKKLNSSVQATNKKLKKATHIIIVGENEKTSNNFSLKNLYNGDQKIVDSNNILEHLK